MTAVLRSRKPNADESGRRRHSGRRVSFMGRLVILAVDEGAHKPRARRTAQGMKPSERQKLDERKGAERAAATWPLRARVDPPRPSAGGVNFLLTISSTVRTASSPALPSPPSLPRNSNHCLISERHCATPNIFDC